MAPLSKETVLAGLRAAERIASGQLPTEADLDSAPRLIGWGLHPESNAGLHRLVGIVTGHPTIDDGPCVTSAVLALDKDRRWARTVSRFYVLGPSLQDMLEQDDG